MKNRTPAPARARPPIPAFDAVPRACARHDGWTPERQRAFIEALADTGSVSTACRMVNMASEGAYALRRHPQAESFRAAWHAALDMGVLRMKDEAFDRALNGQLVPVFTGGRLAGYRRKKNDRLLMFILRHYGADANGRRVTLNLFQTSGAPASAPAAAPSRAIAPRAEARLPAPGADASAAAIANFPPVTLDDVDQAAIQAILARAAARARDADPDEDPAEPFVEPDLLPIDHPDAIGWGIEDAALPEIGDGNEPWQTLDQPDQREAIAAIVKAIEAGKRKG